MKIPSSYVPQGFQNKIDCARATGQINKNKKLGKNFDEIIISSNKPALSDEAFASELSKKISSEIKAADIDSSDRLSQIKSQLENGSFKPSVEELAKKILRL